MMLLVSKSENGVIRIALDRPEIHNAFNDELIAKIIETFQSISNDSDARLVVLSGSGRSFCAGADLNWMKSMVNYSEADNKKDSENLFEMFDVIDNCPVPVIGAINGHALGGGMGVVSVCDYAITHSKAKFGFTEVRLGLIPAVISSFCMRKINESHARAWFLSGEKFGANTALSMNLVHEVVEPEEFEGRVEELIASFLQAGPIASREAKKLIKNLEKAEDIKDFTCSEIARLRVSSEGQEGMNALLEKRKASWYEN